MDWLTTQIPTDSRFQIYAFNTKSGSVVPDKAAQWLDGGDRETLDDAVVRVRGLVPKGGTNLYQAFASIRSLRPAPAIEPLRTFVGDGDRQYLTGLKVGGRRILRLGEASAADAA